MNVYTEGFIDGFIFCVQYELYTSLFPILRRMWTLLQHIYSLLLTKFTNIYSVMWRISEQEGEEEININIHIFVG